MAVDQEKTITRLRAELVEARGQILQMERKLFAFTQQKKTEKSGSARGEGMFQDIQEVSLFRQLEFRQTLIDAIPSPVFFKDLRERYQGGNRAWCEKVIGLPLERTLGCTVYDLPEHIPKALADLFHEQDQVLLRSGGSRIFRHQVQCADGETRDFLFNQAAHTDEQGDPAGLIGVMTDITELIATKRELQQSREQMRNLSGYLQSVREQERMSIARDIHDELGQSLTALKMDLVQLARNYPLQATVFQDRIRAMKELVDGQIQMTKTLVSRLRPGILDDFGLLAAVEWQAEEFTGRSSIPCQVTANEESEGLHLDQESATSVFRIFQEALTNVSRHAGATEVHVGIALDKARLVLTVRDNGRGISQEALGHPNSFGILGMQERARRLGGELTVEGVEGQGTTVELRMKILS
ncbi:MAG: PAS domain-containing protein [Desulfohalobiaceae bacterium]|nr:PAS domain-containing protein [Desulfohalobiaceae bacterium]